MNADGKRLESTIAQAPLISLRTVLDQNAAIDTILCVYGNIPLPYGDPNIRADAGNSDLTDTITIFVCAFDVKCDEPEWTDT